MSQIDRSERRRTMNIPNIEKIRKWVRVCVLILLVVISIIAANNTYALMYLAMDSNTSFEWQSVFAIASGVWGLIFLNSIGLILKTYLS
jgi:hypothetical protein